MAAITAAVAIGAVAAGGMVAQGMAQKSAAKKASSAQRDALNNLEYIDIDKLSDDALAADQKRFEEQFKLQEKVDPTVAGLRKEGAAGLLEGLKDDPGANDLLNQLTQEGIKDSPKRQALIDQLIDGAEAELNAGATLPPEFQAELVRAGLEATGGAGTTGSGAAGVEARTLLGKAGIDLKAHRQTQASNLLATADALKQNRAAILANTLGAVENAKGLKQGRQMNAYSIGAAGVPAAGLTGADVANLNVANLNQKNAATMQKGQIGANDAIARGQFTSQMIGAGTTLATSAIGAFGPGLGVAGAAGTAANPRGYTNTYGRGTYLA